MDSLTQILLGVATAQVCQGKNLGKRTIAYGAIIGTLPDLDILVGKFFDPVTAVAIHRGFSHSLLFFAILAPILGLLISKLEKKRVSWQSATILTFCCLTTHVLLDLFTSWGTQILWPIETKFAFKTIFVIDPLYSIPLAISLIIAFRNKNIQSRNNIVWKGIGISSAYLFLTVGIKLFATSKFQDALQQDNIQYTQLIVKPTALNCILWNANVETQDGYLLADYSLFDTQPIKFTRYNKNFDIEKNISQTPAFQTLKKVSEDWYIITQHNDVYYFNDLRFGVLNKDQDQPQFVFSYQFQHSNSSWQVIEVPKQERDGMQLLKDIANRIKGN